jgi:hypothetical protein
LISAEVWNPSDVQTSSSHGTMIYVNQNRL